MAVSGITITAERLNVVDFTYPSWLEPSAAVVHVSFLRKFTEIIKWWQNTQLVQTNKYLQSVVCSQTV